MYLLFVVDLLPEYYKENILDHFMSTQNEVQQKRKI